MLANPGHKPGKPCVYVGMTGKDPIERFGEHIRGYKAGRIPHKYGVRLRESEIKRRGYRAQSFEAAGKRERELAEQLRALGWAVSQG